MNDEPGFSVEVYGGDDGEVNLLDHQTNQLSIRVYHRLPNDLAQLVLTVNCARLPDGSLETTVQDNRKPTAGGYAFDRREVG